MHRYLVRKAFFLALIALGVLPETPRALAAGISKDLLSTVSPKVVEGTTLLAVIITLINIFLFVAGVVAFVYAIWGGFQYITAGSDDAKATNGRKTIINAVIGIIIIGLAFVLVRFATNFTAGFEKATTDSQTSQQIEQNYFSNNEPPAAQRGNSGASDPNPVKDDTIYKPNG